MSVLISHAENVSKKLINKPHKCNSFNKTIKEFVSPKNNTRKYWGIHSIAPLKMKRKGTKKVNCTEKAANAINQVLSTDVAINVNRWFRGSFTEGSSTVYDQAMDYARQLTGEFGGNHRLFDGGHTLTGAWDKVKKALPNDSIFDETIGYISALAKDGFTPAGLPVMTFDREKFTRFIEDTGISRSWVEDAASVTGFELIGSSISGVAVFLKWNKGETEAFTQMVAGMGIYSISSANPLLAITAISSLAYAWQSKATNNRSMIKNVAKGVTAPIVFVTVAGAVPGPALLGLLAGAATAHAAKQAIDKNESGISFDKVIASVDKQITHAGKIIFSTFKEASEYARNNPGFLLKRDGCDWEVTPK